MKTKRSFYRILHAESDQRLAVLVAERLTYPRYNVFRATTGARALAVAEDIHPHIAILGARLPDGSGYELCRRLRATALGPSLPIILFSFRRRGRVKGLNAGADAFLGGAEGACGLLPAVRGLLKRSQAGPGPLSRHGVRLDPRGNAVYLEEELQARLSRDEFLFLHELVRKSPALLSPAELKEGVLKDCLGGYRSLEKLVTRTRRRLGKPLAPRIRGTGRFGWLFVARPGAF